ncbi:MAG: alkaline phosphatase family protein [Thaumarchaeota archaeon]|nr:alkaline phosphatase family protein [Nitrososphaerota archaeon]
MRTGFLVLTIFSLILILFSSGFHPISYGESATRTPISHVVFVMMENHSFDNFFGVYPTTNETNVSSTISQIQKPINLLNLPQPQLSEVPNTTFFTQNPVEGFSTYHSDWDNGKMDGFAQHSGSQSLTYFTSAQLALEWDWAEEYGLGDMYFSSSLTVTVPNRLFSLAGQSSVTGDNGPPPYLPVNQSIFSQLSNNGVSWGYYLGNPAHDWYPLNYFSGIDKYSQQIQSWTSFFSSLSNGSLPSVSWVMPVGGGASHVSQHPTENVTTGELWLANIVNSVMQSSYWKSTAIFVTYDEGGGYYDQVPPPVVGGNQLGFRVPLIVISPYAKEDYVSSTLLNHGSTLAFIEYNWNLSPLNGFIASSNIPLDFFDFNMSYPYGSAIRGPMVSSQSAEFPQPFQIPINELPYSRSGNSSILLGESSSSSSQSISSTVGGQSTSSPTIPIQIFESPTFLVVASVVVVITVGTLIIATRHRHK